MDLFSFLSWVQLFAILPVVFQTSTEKVSRWLGILILLISAVFVLEGLGLYSLFSALDPETTFPGACLVGGLILAVRSQDRTLPAVIMTCAGIQFGISLGFLDSLT